VHGLLTEEEVRGMAKQTTAYLVPFNALKRSAGSRDKQILDSIFVECAELLDEADLNRDEDQTRTCAEALTDLVNGADLKGIRWSEGNGYGLSLEAICARLGTLLGEIITKSSLSAFVKENKRVGETDNPQVSPVVRMPRSGMPANGGADDCAGDRAEETSRSSSKAPCKRN
jgi:hypothetical protein